MMISVGVPQDGADALPECTADHARNLLVRQILGLSVLTQDEVDQLWVDYMPAATAPEALAEGVSTHTGPGAFRPPSERCWRKIAASHPDNRELLDAVASSISDRGELKAFVAVAPGSLEAARRTYLYEDASSYGGDNTYKSFVRERNAEAAARYIDTHGRDSKEAKLLSSSVVAGPDPFRDAVLSFLTNEEMVSFVVEATAGLAAKQVTRRFLEVVYGKIDEGLITGFNAPSTASCHADVIANYMNSIFGGQDSDVLDTVVDPSLLRDEVRERLDVVQSTMTALSNAKSFPKVYRSEEYGQTLDGIIRSFNLQAAMGQEEQAATYILHQDMITPFSIAGRGQQARDLYLDAVDLLEPHKWIKWANGKMADDYGKVFAGVTQADALSMLLSYGPNYRAELRQVIFDTDAAVAEYNRDKESQAASAAPGQEAEKDEYAHMSHSLSGPDPDSLYSYNMSDSLKVLTVRVAKDTDLPALSMDTSLSRTIAVYFALRSRDAVSGSLTKAIDGFFSGGSSTLTADEAADIAFD